MGEISIAEAAKICGVDKRTIKKWIKAGLLKVKRRVVLEYDILDKAHVSKFAKTLPNERKRGFPILPDKASD